MEYKLPPLPEPGVVKQEPVRCIDKWGNVTAKAGDFVESEDLAFHILEVHQNGLCSVDPSKPMVIKNDTKMTRLAVAGTLAAMASRLTFATPHPASVVQQEPVAWMYDWAPAGSPRSYDWISSSKEDVFAPENCYFNIRPLYTHPAQQAKPQPLSDPLHDDIQSVLFEVEEAIKNGCCPWQIEAAFEAYEAARRLQQPAHGIQGS